MRNLCVRGLIAIFSIVAKIALILGFWRSWPNLVLLYRPVKCLDGWPLWDAGARAQKVESTQATHVPPPDDTLNGNHKQLRGGKGNAAHQQTTNNFIQYCTVQFLLEVNY